MGEHISQSYESKEKHYDKVVLEIGSGLSSAPWLSEKNVQNYRNAHIIRTDINSRDLEQQKKDDSDDVQRLGNNFQGDVDYIETNAAKLALSNGSVDQIYIANVLGDPEFAEKKQNNSFFKEAARVLKNNGQLIIAEWVTPQVALGIHGAHRLTTHTAVQTILEKFAGKLRVFGLVMESIEFPEYKVENDYQHADGGSVDSKSRFQRGLQYIQNFPYAQKMIGGLAIPRRQDHYPFVIVLKKNG